MKHTPSGRWFVSFKVTRSAKTTRRPRRPNAVGGLDVGLRRAGTLSTGHIFKNARPLKHALRELRRLQRSADRRRRACNPGNYHPDGTVKKGCTTWVKSRGLVDIERRIARLHERVANLRREQAHLTTTALVREFGVIAVETLAVKNMLKDRRLARHISDVGWGMIVEQLQYKTGWAGSALYRADRFYPSSKTCSECGTVKAKLDRSETVFYCEACGFACDRDENAGRNLAQMGLRFAHAEGMADVYVARAARVTQTKPRRRPAGRASDAWRARKPRASVRAALTETRRVPGLIPAPRGAGRRNRELTFISPGSGGEVGSGPLPVGGPFLAPGLACWARCGIVRS